MTKQTKTKSPKKKPAAKKKTPAKNKKAPLLTPRERDVLQGAAHGEGLKQTAERLTIKEKTVETHRSSIFRKLDVSNISQAVSVGFRKRIIE